MINIEQSAQKYVAKIEGEMTIYNAAELKDALVPLLVDGREFEIDLSDITEIDSAGVQLLMLVKRECLRHEQSLKLINHSHAVLDVFELMDLVSYFKDPILLSGMKE